MRSMILFSLATLLPVPLLALGAVSGGWCTALALVYLTGLTFTLDTLIKIVTPPVPESEFPAANGLSVVLAVLHFPLLGLIVFGLAGDTLSTVAKIALFLAAGMYFGQVGNSNAHELIHRGARHLHQLGKWVYISLLFGHHTSAHPLVHHRFVATDMDPNTSRLGETYYAYLPRAWIGSFKAGLKAENARRKGQPLWTHPYAHYIGGAVLMIAIAAVIGGLKGAAIYVLLAGYAQSQLMLSDYVQHYGLTRKIDENGKPEPVGAKHSWNSPHWFSSALMLNAPRHSDHHAHPSREYPALDLPVDGPMLPRSLPTMATLALFPSRWFKVMNPRVRRLRA
nr:alkane 1-monooxygenase [Cognatiyoonia koreensis]